MSTRPTLTSLNEEPGAEEKPPVAQGSFMLSLNEQSAGAPAAKVSTKISVFNIILLSMVLGSVSLIITMRKFGLNSASAATDIKIDYVRAKEDPERKLRQDRAIARLDAEQSTPATQISPKSVVVSPFFENIKIESKIGVSDPNDLSDRQKLEAQRRLQERADAIKSAFDGLKLESILNGVKPVARINKETVAVGDTIGKIFKVISIKDRTVELMSDGEIYVLELGGKLNVKDGRRNPKPSPTK